MGSVQINAQKKWEYFESSCLRGIVFNGVESNTILCSQPWTLTSSQCSPLGSEFSSHVSYKELEELHWTLTNWSSMCNLRAFPGSQDGPKQVCRRGQLGGISHSAAQHSLASYACYSPSAGSLYHLTQKSCFIDGGWLPLYRIIRLKFPIFLNTTIVKLFCYVGQDVDVGGVPPHFYQLYNQLKK